MKRVVVTSVSLATPIGNTYDDFCKSMLSGKSGIVNIKKKGIVPNNFPIHYAGLLSLEKDLKYRTVKTNREANKILFKYILKKLLGSAHLPDQIDGVILGTNDNLGWEEAFFCKDNHQECAKFTDDFFVPIIKEVCQEKKIAIASDQTIIKINNTCISGTSAVGQAFQRIKYGQWKAAIAGAIEGRINQSTLLQLNNLGALSTLEYPDARASRPFTKNRSGFIKAEGAGLILIEELHSALNRGAHIIGEIVSYSQTSDALKLEEGRADFSSSSKVIQNVLKEAKLAKEEIDYINLHGSSTLVNDQLETNILKNVFCEHVYDIPMSSLKSQIGHTNIACAIIEIIACLGMLENQFIAPTINYDMPDPQCDLDYVENVARKKKLKNILSNNYGFGGYNSSIILRKFE